jgi:hypothetical protein
VANDPDALNLDVADRRREQGDFQAGCVVLLKVDRLAVGGQDVNLAVVAKSIAVLRARRMLRNDLLPGILIDDR